MESTLPIAFGTLLRRHRRAASLTQEEVAERAGVSVRAISDLERGVRHAPHKDTIRLLVEALGLQVTDQAVFESAAGRLRAPGSLTPPGPNLTGMAVPPLVGRQRELALLERHLAGQGPPVLLLAGEPGIGKTRLLQAASSRAAAHGWRVLEGGCRQRGGQEPYAPLLEALQRHILSQRATDLRAHLRGCAWLVRLLPELAEGSIPPLPTWTTSPEQERRLMVEAVGRFLGNIAGRLGTLLVLDDLQWAGQDALDVLGTLVRSSAATPVRLIAAYRDTEVPQEAPLSALLTDLAHAGLTVHRGLGPLATAEAARLLDTLLEEGNRGAARHARLLRRAGGVPFFLVSCVQAIRAGEDQDGEAIPWDVAQTVRQRMTALPEGAQEMLRAAAVVGRVAERRVLAAMTQRTGEQLLDALDGACRVGLLDEEDHTSYRFVHDMVREVVYGDLGAGRRAALHQRAGEALESLPGAYSVEVLAYHYARGDVADKAVLYLERAGDRAAAQLAYLAAADHYQALVVRLERLGRRYEAARVYAKLGLLLTRIGRFVDSLAALQQFADLYSGSARAKQLDQIATAETVDDRHRSIDADEDAVNFNTILSLMEEHEPEQTRGVLYLAYAYYSCVTSRPWERLIVTERAVELARRLRDGGMLAQALSARSMALLMIGRRAEGFAAAHEALHLCEVRGDLGLMNDVLKDLIFIHVHRGEFALGNLYNDRSLEIAEAVGDTYEAAWATERRAWSAKQTGDWEHAQADLARALQLAPEMAHDTWFNCMHGELCLVKGAWDDARAYLELAVAEAVGLGYVPPQVCAQGFLAELDLLEGQPAAALARVQSVMDQDQGEYTPILLVWSALAFLQLGELDQAEAAARQGVRGAIEADDRLALPDALRIQAMVAMGRKRWEEAERILAEGLTLTRQIGFPYAEVRLLHVHGLMYVRNGEAGPAHERLAAAQALFQRLGAHKDLERVTQDLIGAGQPQ
ncbi:MAG TPA: AAA family ATPase [Chloroflexota bacterium]|nr:AAA family ATPase [Chloroflexota bacterium]